MNDHIEFNKDENVHRFALSAIRGREGESNKCDKKCDLR